MRALRSSSRARCPGSNPGGRINLSKFESIKQFGFDKMEKFAELPEVERKLIEKWYEVKDLAENYPDPEVRRILMDFLIALDDWVLKLNVLLDNINLKLTRINP
jgi:hypothetical protein